MYSILLPDITAYKCYWFGCSTQWYGLCVIRIFRTKTFYRWMRILVVEFLRKGLHRTVMAREVARERLLPPTWVTVGSLCLGLPRTNVQTCRPGSCEH